MAIFAFCAAVLLMLSAPAFAEPSCDVTPRIAVSQYPGAAAIPTTNNLLLPTGKSIEAEGQKLLLQGRLVDSQCMPVKEAVVEIWQVDPFGKYTLASLEDVVTPRPYFAGAGRAITDADGYFTFTTGFPGIISYYVWETYKVKVKGEVELRKRRVLVRRAPHINLLVKADGFQAFSTVLFFDGDRRNAEDPVFKKLKAEDRAGVLLGMSQADEAQVVASKEFVLPGRAPYRTY